MTLHRAIFLIGIILASNQLVVLKAATETDIPKPTFLLKPVEAAIERGETGDVRIDVIPAYGRQVLFELSSYPKFGSLTEGEKSDSSLVLHYCNNKKFNSKTDAFVFRVKAPGHAWNTYTAEIQIQNPPATLNALPNQLNFGVVPVGITASKTLVLSNSFGAQVSGTLLIPPPWTVSGESGFSLEEGESKSVTIEFTPNESVKYSSQLMVSPQLSNFPLISLTGSGAAPFLLTSTSVVVGSENPTAYFSVSNTSKSPLRIGWMGDSTLDFSPDLTIPPDGVEQMWISAKQLNLPIESEKIFHPFLRNDSFSQQLELIVHGPKGSVSLEALRGKEMLFTKVGKTVSLQGIVHNKSATNHTLTLLLQEETGVSQAQPSPFKTVSIPAGQDISFTLPWSPKKAGLCSPSVNLLEDGKIISSAEWKLSVDPVDNTNETPSISKVSQPIEWKSSASDTPTNPSAQIIRGASEQEKQMVVIWLPPRFQEGLIFRSLVFRWRYLGSDQSGFVLKEHHIKNAFADRTGENSDEWNQLTLKKKPEKIEYSGIWEQMIPIPFPGTHEYMISTAGSGEKMVALQKITISWGLFLWPMIRLFLILSGVVILIKVIRRRKLWR